MYERRNSTMKKSIVLSLVFAMLLAAVLSFAPTGFAKADTTVNVTFSDIIALGPDTGVYPYGIGFWGNHESRTVHTNHGDYVVYTTDDIGGSGAFSILSGFSIIKIDEEGKVSLIAEEYRARESSGVTMFEDNDGNIWVVEIGENKIMAPGAASSVHVGAYRIDAKTDELTYFVREYDIPHIGMGFGYGSACYDPTNNVIIAETADGDNSQAVDSGKNSGMILWAVLDLNEELPTWSNDYHKVDLDIRYSYPYITADGKGGFIVIAGQDFSCGSAGYPEILDRTNGMDPFEWAEYKADYADQSAGYVWHSIHMIWVKNMYENNNFEFFDVAPADYSRVEGDMNYRYSLEGRLNNQYPNFQNNNGGDVLLDKNGYLHVVWYKMYLYAASTRAEADNAYYHEVYDVNAMLAGKSIEEAHISTSFIANGVEDDCAYSFRLYEDNEGNLYYISGSAPKIHGSNGKLDVPQNIKGESRDAKLTVYALSGSPEEGYTKTAIAEKNYTGGYIVNLSSRGNSVKDNTCNVLVNNNDGNFMRLTFDIQKTADVDVQTVDGITLNGAYEAFAGGTVVSAVNASDDAAVKAAMANAAGKFVAFDVTALLNGEAQQPMSKVTAVFNIPADYDIEKVALFYVESADKFEEVASTIDKEARTLTAELEHFSKYVVAEKADVVEPTPTPVPGGDDEKNTAMILYIVFGVLVAALVVIAVVSIVSKKKGAKK